MFYYQLGTHLVYPLILLWHSARCLVHTLIKKKKKPGKKDLRGMLKHYFFFHKDCEKIQDLWDFFLVYIIYF